MEVPDIAGDVVIDRAIQRPPRRAELLARTGMLGDGVAGQVDQPDLCAVGSSAGLVRRCERVDEGVGQRGTDDDEDAWCGHGESFSLMMVTRVFS